MDYDEELALRQTHIKYNLECQEEDGGNDDDEYTKAEFEKGWMYE